MRKKNYVILSTLLIVTVVTFEVSKSRMYKRDVIYSLLDIEKQAAAENIDYTVKGKSNNPKTCTLEVWVDANGNVGNQEAGVSGHFKKVSGIVNTCSGSDGTCDPYNCHQRI